MGFRLMGSRRCGTMLCMGGVSAVRSGLMVMGLLLLSGLCSCVQTHRRVYELPRSYEGVWMPNNSEAQNHNTADMKLTARLYVYEAGGQWYLPVRRITFIRRPNALGTWGRPPYTVTRETARDPQTYYLPLSAETARQLMTPQRSAVAPRTLAPRTPVPLLPALPPQAQAQLIRCPVCDFGGNGGGLVWQTAEHTDTGAVWAYPAAALLAVGVDFPLSVIGSTAAYTIGGFYALLCPSQVFR